jgi:hypothetical protein
MEVIELDWLHRIGKSQRMAEDDLLESEFDVEMLMQDPRAEDQDDFDRTLGIRRGIDLATTLERIEKNFVITDPRLPDNPIVSDMPPSHGGINILVVVDGNVLVSTHFTNYGHN